MKNWWININYKKDHCRNCEFSYEHNDHTKASKYFDLLINFWNHPNELLKLATELSIELVAKTTKRLPEFLKFINDHFSYKVEDLHNGFQRQNILLEILSTENRSSLHREIANGTLLNIWENSTGLALHRIWFKRYL